MSTVAMSLERGWERWFGSSSLGRGLAYYSSGLVDLERAAEGWRGHADGSERYDVFLAADGSGTLSPANEGTYCTCPHAMSGNYCKHLAAACYLVEDELEMLDARGEGDAAAENRGGEDARDVLDRLGDSEKAAFLREVVETDEGWRRELLGRYGVPDTKRACRELSQDIHSAILAHSYRGFIEWRDALPFEHDFLFAIERASRPLVNRALVDDVLALGKTALEELRRIEIDDSDGFYGTAIDACIEIWKDVLEVDGSDTAKDKMLDAVLDLLDEEEGANEVPDVLGFEQEAAETWIIDRFASDAHTAERMLAIAVARIEPPSSSVSVYEGHYARESSKWVLASLRSMKALGKTSAERREFAEPHLGNQAVRQALVDDALENGEREIAIGLLEEGERQFERAIERASGENAWKVTYLKRNLKPLSLQLLDMREEDGDTGEVIAQLRKVLALDDDPSLACEHASRLHELVGDDLWEEERERVLNSALSGGIRRDLLAQDGLVERLMDDIESTGSTYDLMAYEDVLKSRYAERILVAYRRQLESNLSHAASRKAYQSGIAILSRFGNIEGGDSARDAACAWIRQTYPRKRALQDELDKRMRTWL